MKKENESNRIVRQCLTDALFLLLKEKHIDEITIKELVDRAGVGRVSFYRNYKSKQDILLCYMNKLADSWWENVKKEKKPDIILRMFELFVNMKTTIQILYDSSLSILLYEFIRRTQFHEKAYSVEEEYTYTRRSGLIFGWCDQWVRRGMKESPEDMSRIISLAPCVTDSIVLFS